ncbi:hypothetical protein [Moorena sp. SIO4G3]|uniref:hypothetical protein n=1 Tax=Moorena sp. SIO4G3 TaxID=2607821 RepID=UPI0013C97DAA|nr:hypothetical protein [Moorena sp. SIO4G3]NEO76639.1 hypothetical protein [Moorena sp. SIO4G3]NEO96129.1 hypothetical protein [Moorena sp. SIO3G5]
MAIGQGGRAVLNLPQRYTRFTSRSDRERMSLRGFNPRNDIRSESPSFQSGESSTTRASAVERASGVEPASCRL